MRCFKCNRFGHVALKCKNKERCSRCGGDHAWKTCVNTQKCVNCGGDHSPVSKTCPKCSREAEISMHVPIASSGANLRIPSVNADFPALPSCSGTGTIPISSRPPLHVTVNSEPLQAPQIDTLQMDKIDFPTILCLVIPFTSLHFLRRSLIKQLLAKPKIKQLMSFK